MNLSYFPYDKILGFRYIEDGEVKNKTVREGDLLMGNVSDEELQKEIDNNSQSIIEMYETYELLKDVLSEVSLIVGGGKTEKIYFT